MELAYLLETINATLNELVPQLATYTTADCRLYVSQTVLSTITLFSIS